MGRNITNTVEYFSHFVEHGRTLYILERKWKNDGYAVWFKLLELLGKTEGHYLDVRDEMDFEYMLAHMNTPEITVTEILDTLAKLGKIDSELWDNKIIWCSNFVEGLDRVYSKRGRNLPQKPTLKSISDAEKEFSSQVGTDSASNSDSAAEMPQSIVEYSKEEKSTGEGAREEPFASPVLAKRTRRKENTDKSTEPEADIPDWEDWYQYTRGDLRYSEQFIQHLWDHVQVNGWCTGEQGNKPIRDWRAYARKQSQWAYEYDQKQKKLESNTHTNGKGNKPNAQKISAGVDQLFKND